MRKSQCWDELTGKKGGGHRRTRLTYDDCQRQRHQGRDPEDGREGVGHAELLLKHERVGERPAKSSKRRGREDHDHSWDGHGCCVPGHEKDAGGDESDNADKLERVGLEAKGEGEDKDEDKGLRERKRGRGSGASKRGGGRRHEEKLTEDLHIAEKERARS